VGLGAGRQTALWSSTDLGLGAPTPLQLAVRRPPGAWGAPTTTAAWASGAVLAEAEDGLQVAAWRADDGLLMVATGDEAPVTLGPVDGAPAVATARGRAAVAWCAGDRLLVADRAGPGWSPPVAATAVDRGVCADAEAMPAIAVNARGHAVLAWRAFAFGRPRVEAARRRGGSWSAPRVLGQAPRGVGAPAVGLGPRGGAVVAWTHPVSPSVSVIATRAAAGGGAWGPRRTVRVRGHRELGPAVGVDALGRVTLSWLSVPLASYRRGLRVMVAVRGPRLI